MVGANAINAPKKEQRTGQVDPLSSIKPLENIVGRLQMQPKPLEAGHVIDMAKQLLVFSVGYFPDGQEIKITYNNYKYDDFIVKLGGACATVYRGHGATIGLSCISQTEIQPSTWGAFNSIDRGEPKFDVPD